MQWTLKQKSHWQDKDKRKWQDDYVRDDSALVLPGGGRHFIITGCSHSGICNISAIRPIGMRTAAGSRHHRDSISLEADERLVRTIDYLKCCGAEQIYPCHCITEGKSQNDGGLEREEKWGLGMELCLDGQAAH